jgi:excinuclease UvrABC nuclease subunit
MNVLHAISELPQTPAVYAMYGGKGPGRYVAYVGVAQKLRDRMVQHLARRDSSVAAGTSTVPLNPRHVLHQCGRILFRGS